MKIPNPVRYRMPGHFEYILVKAGLFHAEAGPIVKPTDELRRLAGQLPHTELLIRLAEVAAWEVGGAINAGMLKPRLVGQMREAGIDYPAQAELYAKILAGAKAAAEELASMRPLSELYL